MPHRLNTVASLPSTLTQLVVSPNFYRSPMTFYESTLKLRSTRNVFAFSQFFKQLKNLFAHCFANWTHSEHMCDNEFLSLFFSITSATGSRTFKIYQNIKIINEKSAPSNQVG